MSERSWIWLTTGLALAVAAAAFVASSSTLDGAILATRFSARFSGLVMAVAVLARASRPAALHAQRSSLALAFVAAHGVHYATIIARAFLDPSHKLRHPGPIDLAGLVGGFGLILVIAVTARKTATVAVRLNAVAISAGWAILTFVSAARALHSMPSFAVFAALVTAMLWRMYTGIVARGS